MKLFKVEENDKIKITSFIIPPLEIPPFISIFNVFNEWLSTFQIHAYMNQLINNTITIDSLPENLNTMVADNLKNLSDQIKTKKTTATAVLFDLSQEILKLQHMLNTLEKQLHQYFKIELKDSFKEDDIQDNILLKTTVMYLLEEQAVNFQKSSEAHKDAL